MLTFISSKLYPYPIIIISGGLMRKSFFFALIGYVALLIFFVIIFSPMEITAPIATLGVTCFFVFLMMGIPATVVIFDPHAIDSLTFNKKTKR